MTPTWKTPKDLGIIADGYFFEKRLEAVSPSQTLQYHVISGDLPSGVSLSSFGSLYGVPTVMNDKVGEINFLVNFTVRAEDDRGFVSDRTFKLLVSGVQAPTIETLTSNLGVYYDGSYFSY